MTEQSLPFEAQSQEDAILDWLKAGRSLTPIAALDLFKCFRLGARIYGLKKRGYKIESEMVKVPSGKHVARYRLVS